MTHDLTFAWPSDDLQLGVAALGSEELAARCEGPAVGGAQGLARSSTAFHVALLVLIHPQELQRVKAGDKQRKHSINKSFFFRISVSYAQMFYSLHNRCDS